MAPRGVFETEDFFLFGIAMPEGRKGGRRGRDSCPEQRFPAGSNGFVSAIKGERER